MERPHLSWLKISRNKVELSLDHLFWKCSWLGRGGIQIHNSANNLNWLSYCLIMKAVSSVLAYCAIAERGGGAYRKNNKFYLECLHTALQKRGKDNCNDWEFKINSFGDNEMLACVNRFGVSDLNPPTTAWISML